MARLFFRHRVARLDQSVEFFLLLGNAPGRPFFILRARRRRSLFDQLPDIVPKHRDAVVEFRQRKRIVVAHVHSLNWTGETHAIANAYVDLVVSHLTERLARRRVASALELKRQIEKKVGKPAPVAKAS